MEAFADAVGLRMPGLGTAMIDILQCQIKTVLMTLPLAVVLCTPVCEYRSSGKPCSSKNGSTLSLSISAAVKAFLRSYNLAKATLL